MGNVHEIVQGADDQVRVLYVDKEPIGVAHADLLLAGDTRATVVRVDLCEPEAVLHAAQDCHLLDLTAPIGLLAVSVLQWVPDWRCPHDIVAAYRDRLAPGRAGTAS